MGWFMGPDTAEVGESIRISVSGFDGCTKASFSAFNADLSSTLVQLADGFATIRARMVSAGSASITARGYDENGAVAHEATHQVQVHPRNRAQDTGFEEWGEGEHDVKFFCTKPIVGQVWKLAFRNVGDCESLVVEMQGSNGGIFRLFPRGRMEMRTHLTPKAPGRMAVHVTKRNARLDPLNTKTFIVEVQQATDQMAAAPETFAETASEAAPSAPALDPVKPPYLLPHDTFAGEETGSTLAASGQPAGPGQSLASSLGSASPEEIARDMQARTDALLNRLKKG
ncbi:hypothetical protein [Henriciella sp.]|uniref:hypothetical protein n=1 Tax=Henriciella sp. TaxID=1968823 RepID=UPI002620F459|nr:hypothetical protein [Henriciella sp.]